MDEEFFFPQNVRTSYRLWLLGPRHLKRLAGAPVLAGLVVWICKGLGLLPTATLAALLVSTYVVLTCLPVLAGEQTLSDIWQELNRHRKSQTRFATEKEVDFADEFLEKVGA